MFFPQSHQAKGLLLALCGVLSLTPDTLLIRLVDVDNTALFFWRGCCTLFGMTAITYFQHQEKTIQQFRNIGKIGIAVTLCMGLSSIFFVSALYYTSVANTLVIVSASPMFAALYSRIFLKESVALRTLLTMLIVSISISFIVGDTKGPNSIQGNCLAILAAIFISGAFTLMRKGRDRNMIPATALSGGILIIVGFLFAPTLAVSWSQLIIILCMGVSSVLGFVCITNSTKYISSPEISLLMPLETVLGTCLVWLVLHEAASLISIVGGLIVIIALTCHALLSLKRTKSSLLN